MLNVQREAHDGGHGARGSRTDDVHAARDGSAPLRPTSSMKKSAQAARERAEPDGHPSASGLPAQIEALRPYCLRIAYLELRDRHAAEDCVQDALLAALKDVPNFAGRSSVKTWLVAILRNKIVDTLRQRARHVTEPLDDEAEVDEGDADFDAHGRWAPRLASWGDAEGSLERKEFLTALDLCLEGLPARQARAFMLREVFGLEADEICKTLGISSSNLWVSLYRARMALRGCLQSKWFASDGNIR
jgi:RNA polymerase sigma-70 factor (ECF subfamily)